jgi:2-keto-4-pentenoate hydratase/2-oxohepta-3-ene-1,7-dioic acid hydratase in catechol pathway
MRIARVASLSRPHHVVQDADRWLEIADPFAPQRRFTGNEYPVGTVRFLAPVQPVVVLGMAHHGPGDRPLPRQAFLKSPRTVAGPDEDIVVDERLGQVHVEGELAVVVETELDPSAVPITVRVNGEDEVSANTAQLAWGITEQPVYLTSYLSLGPADIVLTGVHGTFFPVTPGDHSEVALDGIGPLSNPVRAR